MSDETIVRVRGKYKGRDFTAGMILQDGRVTAAAPILNKHVRGKTTDEARAWLRENNLQAGIVGQPFVVGVTGGRNYTDGGRKDEDTRLWHALSRINRVRPISALSHGDANAKKGTGADQIGKKWAQANGVPDLPFPAKWDDLSHPNARIRTRADGTQYDAAAGLRRNVDHLEQARPHALVAAPGGTGTAHMMGEASRRRIRTVEVPARRKEQERQP